MLPVLALDGEQLIDEPTHEPGCVGPDVLAPGLRDLHLPAGPGNPKGVMVEHRGLCNLAMAQASLFAVHREAALQFASFSFDASAWEVVMALSHGACLCLASREALHPGEPLLEILRSIIGSRMSRCRRPRSWRVARVRRQPA